MLFVRFVVSARFVISVRRSERRAAIFDVFSALLGAAHCFESFRPNVPVDIEIVYIHFIDVFIGSASMYVLFKNSSEPLKNFNMFLEFLS